MKHTTNPLARVNPANKNQRLRLLSNHLRTEEQRPVRSSRGDMILAPASAVAALTRNAEHHAGVGREIARAA